MSTKIRQLTIGTANDTTTAINAKLTGELQNYGIAAALAASNRQTAAVIYQQVGHAMTATIAAFPSNKMIELEDKLNALLAKTEFNDYAPAASFLSLDATEVFVVLQKKKS